MITLSGDIGQRLNSGMDLGGGVKLPFDAPVFWVVNGNTQLRAAGGVVYMGGWAAKHEDIDDVMRNNGLELPIGLIDSTIDTKGGGSFAAYTSRSLIVAPIANRQTWQSADGGRSSDYQDGYRMHVQALCYLGYKDKDGAYIPWGPVVLSAKGHQAKNLLQAFKDWSRHTAPLRKKIAPDVPAWCFYLAIGTFGKDIKTVLVGKGSQSSITPIEAYLPADMKEATLEKLFVGEEIAAVMADRLGEAEGWLGAWNKGAPAGGGNTPEPPPNWVDDSMEDIPF